MKTETVTTPYLIEFLRQLRHAQPIAITALVPCETRRFAVDGSGAENPYYKATWKLSKVAAFTGINHSASVNRQRVREGLPPDFVAQERPWGERIAPALVRNVNKDDEEYHYLIAQVLRALIKPVYLVKRPDFGLVPIAKSAIEPFLPVEQPTRQGVEKEVIYRNYRLDHLTRLQAEGRNLRHRRHDEAEA